MHDYYASTRVVSLSEHVLLHSSCVAVRLTASEYHRIGFPRGTCLVKLHARSLWPVLDATAWCKMTDGRVVEKHVSYKVTGTECPCVGQKVDLDQKHHEQESPPDDATDAQWLDTHTVWYIDRHRRLVRNKTVMVSEPVKGFALLRDDTVVVWRERDDGMLVWGDRELFRATELVASEFKTAVWARHAQDGSWWELVSQQRVAAVDPLCICDILPIPGFPERAVWAPRPRVVTDGQVSCARGCFRWKAPFLQRLPRTYGTTKRIVNAECDGSSSLCVRFEDHTLDRWSVFNGRVMQSVMDERGVLPVPHPFTANLGTQLCDDRGTCVPVRHVQLLDPQRAWVYVGEDVDGHSIVTHGTSVCKFHGDKVHDVSVGAEFVATADAVYEGGGGGDLVSHLSSSSSSSSSTLVRFVYPGYVLVIRPSTTQQQQQLDESVDELLDSSSPLVVRSVVTAYYLQGVRDRVETGQLPVTVGRENTPHTAHSNHLARTRR